MKTLLPCLWSHFLLCYWAAGQLMIDQSSICKGVSIAQYNADLSECQAYADEVEAGRQVARGTQSVVQWSVAR